MLLHLSINNYALINELEIDFKDGLTIITGETGAGKSILLGALALIIGQRADTQVLLNKSKKCIVEGIFVIKDYGMQDFFNRNQLDYEDQTVIRREINQHGKSRAFINDTPVNLELLKELGEMLVDIHSQHNTITLQDSRFQLAFIDAYVQHDELLNEFKTDFTSFSQLNAELRELLQKEKQSKADQDYFQFQFDELQSVQLVDGEQEDIEKELELLNHSEEIKVNLTKASLELSSGDFSMTARLKEVCNIISKLTILHPGLEDISKRLESCSIELKDIAKEIELAEQRIIYSPERISNINDRLNIIYNLQQKHRVNSIKELLWIKDDIASRLSSITNLDKKIEKVKLQLAETDKHLASLSAKITANRKKAIPSIEKGVTAVLAKLAMHDAQFKITHTLLPAYNSFGNDRFVFMFNANKGGEFKELAKVASGGELSRLMLSIKSLISVKKLLPTIIFDEIDQGVSGDIADKVGNIMKHISATMQVVAITHLPQIAGKGSSHFVVYKETDQKATYTKIKVLKEKERIAEIAKMLSGNELTQAALEHAKTLLDS